MGVRVEAGSCGGQSCGQRPAQQTEDTLRFRDEARAREKEDVLGDGGQGCQHRGWRQKEVLIRQQQWKALRDCKLALPNVGHFCTLLQISRKYILLIYHMIILHESMII